MNYRELDELMDDMLLMDEEAFIQKWYSGSIEHPTLEEVRTLNEIRDEYREIDGQEEYDILHGDLVKDWAYIGSYQASYCDFNFYENIHTHETVYKMYYLGD